MVFIFLGIVGGFFMSDKNTFRNAWNALCLAWDSLNSRLPLEAVDRPEEGDKRQGSNIEDIIDQFPNCVRHITDICNFANSEDKNDPENRQTITAILNGENNSDNLGIQDLWGMLAEDFEPQDLKQKGWDVIAANLNAACARLAETFNVQRA
jgi:hypothetical protein